MFYTVYQITNLLDGKIYIGKHQTKKLDDGYMGSGKVLRHAVKKYGVENFKKEILHVFATEAEMNIKEAELVTEDFISRGNTYNLCPGGKGGWGYLNSFEGLEKRKDALKKWQQDGSRKHSEKIANDLDYRDDFVAKARISGLKTKDKYPKGVFAGKKHTADAKKKMSSLCWITNGIVNKKMNKTEVLPIGWWNGRTVSRFRGQVLR